MNIYHKNALALIADQLPLIPELSPAIDALACRQLELGIQAGLEDFLANPFVQTAMAILRTFSKNYKVGQAVKLLEEAGKDYAEDQRQKKKKR